MPARAAIYLDSNAAQPLSPSALKAALSFLSEHGAGASTAVPHRALAQDNSESLGPFLRMPVEHAAAGEHPLVIGNPSSSHSFGRQAKERLAQARAQVARSLGLGVAPSEITFTSSGSEANQMAIRSVLESRQGRPTHWVVSAAEHDSVFEMVRWATAQGVSVSILELDPHTGAPAVHLLKAHLKPETALISVIWVNNETGVITDIDAIAELASSKGAALHLDGAQAWGKLPIEAAVLAKKGVSFVSLAGQKIGGFSGSGALWTSPWFVAEHSLASVIRGKQESGKRGGTENLLGWVSMGASAGALNPGVWAEDIGALRNRLEKAVLESIDGVRVHGAAAPRVANTSNFGFEGVDREGLVMALDLEGYAVSSGSACNSGIVAPSRVLLAMGLSASQASAAVRVSLCSQTRWEELEGFVAALGRCVARARGTNESKRQAVRRL